jgi:hypothetical protein
VTATGSRTIYQCGSQFTAARCPIVPLRRSSACSGPPETMVAHGAPIRWDALAGDGCGVRARRPAAVRHRGHARERALGYIVGTYDEDAGANNQRLYLTGTRVAQMRDTVAISLNSNPLGTGRHAERCRRSLQRPQRRVPHFACPAFRRLDRDHLEQHERPWFVRSGRDRGAGRRSGRQRLLTLVWSSA